MSGLGMGGNGDRRDRVGERVGEGEYGEITGIGGHLRGNIET